MRIFSDFFFHKCSFSSFLKNVKNGDSRFYQEAGEISLSSLEIALDLEDIPPFSWDLKLSSF